MPDPQTDQTITPTTGTPTLPQLPPLQQDTTGMTQMGPQIPQRRPQEGQFRAGGIMALVQMATQKIGERKQRETQQTFDRFTQASHGVMQAKSQMDEAVERLKKNPQDAQARQAIMQAKQAMQQNQTILNDMFSGPHGEKHSKLLSKGFGIDDKNANTPERQAAIQAMKKSMGVGDKAAGILSQLPQTQQLSPEAQRQAMLQQAGAMGKPMTQAQAYTAMNQMARLAQQKAYEMHRMGISDAYIQLHASKQGMVAEPPAVEGGEWNMRPMTPQEKQIYGMAGQGKLAWTLKNGQPVAVLRNPLTNEIIAGSENPAILPPAYLMEHIREGQYFWTDLEGNLHEMPVTTVTKPALGGAAPKKGVAPVPAAAPTTRHTVTPMNPRAQATPSPTGGPVIGKKDVPIQRQMRMEFERDYEKPAETADQSFRLMDSTYREYEALKAQGKEFPTGAQSMLALSQHLQTTFGTVKGGRVTKDMIAHHMGARSVSDDIQVIFQKLNDGDVLSPDQWTAFHDLVSKSRKESWNTAVKEARRHKVPMDFVPPDLLKEGVGAPEGFVKGRDAAGVGSDHKTVVGWMINGKWVPE